MLRTIERLAFKVFTGEFPEEYFARKLHKDQLTQQLFRSQIALEQELVRAGFVAGRDFVSSFSPTHTEFKCSSAVSDHLKKSSNFANYLQCVEALKKSRS